MYRNLIKIFTLVLLSLHFASAMSATVQIRVSADNDDAEEKISDSSMYLDSSDLEFGYDDFVGGLQIVGMRFTNVAIPQGSTINSAYIEFEVDETDTNNTRLRIFGQGADTTNQFELNSNKISTRTRTTATVDWTPPDWTSVNDIEQTVDIASIVEEIIMRPGWVSGNSLVVMIEPRSGCNNINCQRTATSHEENPGTAPLLVIDYTDPVVPASPIGEWRFDELAWAGDGTTIDVLDSSGNDNHGTAVNSATPVVQDWFVMRVVLTEPMEFR